jgi:WD40 repeat protein
MNQAARKDRRITALVGHMGDIADVDFSPDGQQIVTASDDKTAGLWDVRTGALLARLRGHTSPVLSAKFSPDGQRIVTASSDSTARVWDVQKGTEVLVLWGQAGEIDSAEFSPDGHQILSQDRSARLWDSSSGRSLAEWKAEYAAFSKDGGRIVVTSSRSVAEVIDARTRTTITKLIGQGVRFANFSPDGQLILTVDDHVVVWDANSGERLSIFEEPQVEWLHARFSPDGTMVVTATPGGARVWNARTGQKTLDLTSGRIQSAGFSPDGNQIFTQITEEFNNNDRIQLWNANLGTFIDDLKERSGFLRRPVFSRDSRRIAIPYMSGRVWIWNTGLRDEIVLLGHTDSINFAAASEDDTRIATASKDHTARVWDSRTGATLAVLEGHKDGVLNVAFSPDGMNIATGSLDKTARVWDGQTYAEIAALEGHKDRISSITFSPNGQRVLTASWDGTARIWDARTGATLAILEGHQGGFNFAAFSRDGTRIITASSDQAARVWDANTGAPLAVLAGYSNSERSESRIYI